MNTFSSIYTKLQLHKCNHDKTFLSTDSQHQHILGMSRKKHFFFPATWWWWLNFKSTRNWMYSIHVFNLNFTKCGRISSILVSTSGKWNIKQPTLRIQHSGLWIAHYYHLPAILTSYFIILNWARVKKIPYWNFNLH